MLEQTAFALSTGCVRKLNRIILWVIIGTVVGVPAQAQSECFDPGGDCTLSSPQQFILPVEVVCGDTVFLSATEELCNTWTIPDGIQTFPVVGEDSMSIFVIVDQCTLEDIVVDGVTETPSGSGTASCDVQLVYQLYSVPDTVSQGLYCADYFMLDSSSVMLTSSCNCDSLLINYFNLGGGDTILVDNTTCLPDEVGVQVEELIASTGCDSMVITTTELVYTDELFVESQLACVGEVATLWAFQEGSPSYAWSNGETGEVIEVLDSGTYTVTSTDSNGCQNVAEATVTFSDISISLTPTVAGPLVLSINPIKVWEGAAIQMDLEVTGTPYSYEVLWNGGPEIGDDSTYNYIARESDFFMVGVIDSIGCFGLDSVFVEVRPLQVYAPTAFSPNGDGNNDQYEIFTSPNVAELRLQIFARSGGLVYDEILLNPEPLSNGLRWPAWDGQFRNQRLNPQVFVWQLWYRVLRGEWQSLSGDLSLTR